MTTETTQTASLADGYAAAHRAAVVVDRSDLGMLKFTGETRLELINRMSTQKVIGLTSGQGAATVLTTDIGRIIDRLILYAASEAVYCLTGEDNSDTIARYLMRFVFFMDDFQVEDLSAETTILGIYGQQAGALLGKLLGEEVDLRLHHWRELALGDTQVYLHRTDPAAGDGYLVMGQAADGPALLARRVGEGTTPVDEATFDYLRIESGLPRFGRELSEAYIPLEANLWADVSFNKGCYTGQEVIARMESRGRLAKRLVALRPEAPVAAGTELTLAGKGAGTITSAADGPAGPLALGYVKTAALEQQPEALEAGEVRVGLAAAEATAAG